jgi:hypothetical protein
MNEEQSVLFPGVETTAHGAFEFKCQQDDHTAFFSPNAPTSTRAETTPPAIRAQKGALMPRGETFDMGTASATKAARLSTETQKISN